MSVSINLEEAKRTLIKEVTFVKQHGWISKNANEDLIKSVILGTHLTYRYILFNGLLAKVINNKINPVALQAGSSLDGAYDARSLCHKVVVVLESELLECKLGGSNEPFLNKPARFKELSKDNAVRRGKDQETLEHVIKIFNDIKTPEDAIDLFRTAISYTLTRNGSSLTEILCDCQISNTDIIKFAKKVISSSLEGELCAILAGTCFNFMGNKCYKNLNVNVHPVNQCGASSKEISDIDVFSDKLLVWTAEVKDKPFLKQDVDHAVKKILKSNHYDLIFVLGPNSKLVDSSFELIENEWENNGVSITFITVIDLVKMTQIIDSNVQLKSFIQVLWATAKNARVKDEVFNHLRECLPQA